MKLLIVYALRLHMISVPAILLLCETLQLTNIN